jgi:hypothetical protein
MTNGEQTAQRSAAARAATGGAGDGDLAAAQRAETLHPAIARLALLGPAGLRTKDVADPKTAAAARRIVNAGGAAFAALWTEHEAELRSYAAREGIRRPGDSRYFFGEGCARRDGALRRERERRPAPPAEVASRAQHPQAVRIWATRPFDEQHAIHEAGHACVALENGWGVVFADLRPRLAERSLARVRFEYRDGATTVGLILASLAGGEAERRRFGFIARESDAGDVEHAREHLALLFPEATDQDLVGWLDFMRAEAATDVAGCWPWILRTAVALRRYRALSEQQIEHLREPPTERSTT